MPIMDPLCAKDTAIGIYGLGLFTFLSATSVILIFNKTSYAIYSLLPIILCAIYGEMRLSLKMDDVENLLPIRVVQPAISQEEKWAHFSS